MGLDTIPLFMKVPPCTNSYTSKPMMGSFYSYFRAFTPRKGLLLINTENSKKLWLYFNKQLLWKFFIQPLFTWVVSTWNYMLKCILFWTWLIYCSVYIEMCIVVQAPSPVIGFCYFWFTDIKSLEIEFQPHIPGFKSPEMKVVLQAVVKFLIAICRGFGFFF